MHDIMPGNTLGGISDKFSILTGYLSRGWALVPLHDVTAGLCSCGRDCGTSAGKHPRWPRWQETSQLIRDERTLSSHLRGVGGERWNWGVATGPASGIWVLDVDPANGGEEALRALYAELAAEYETLPATLELGPTGGGGRHLVFAWPTDGSVIHGSQTKNRYGLAPGLDIRGAGGQIVVAPSISAKGPYGGVLVDAPVYPVGPVLLARLTGGERGRAREVDAAANGSAGAGPRMPAPPAAHPGHDNGAGVDAFTAARYRAYAEAAAAGLLAELRAAPVGTRNDTAYRTACRLVELLNAPWSGLDPDGTAGAWWEAGLAHPDGARVPADELDGVWQRAVARVGGGQADPPGDGGWLGVGGDVVPFSSISPADASVNGGQLGAPGVREPAAGGGDDARGLSTYVDDVQFSEPGRPVASGQQRPSLCLPEDFWSARPVLAQIRQAAHARIVSGDVALYSVLAKLSAFWPHTVRADTGIKTPASMNLFVAVAGESGASKTSGYEVASSLLPTPQWLSGGQFEDFPMGSGEGIAESFMGMRDEPVRDVDGNPVLTRENVVKTRAVRSQVRHNVLIYVDEGEAFTALGQRNAATIGETIRRAWVGSTIGQKNGNAETTRIVRKETYSLGMIIGFQPDTAQRLLADVAPGTPQRFLWCWATDPAIPDHAPDPGPLTGVWPAAVTADGFSEPSAMPNMRPVELSEHIRAELRKDALIYGRGEASRAPLDSHEPLMRVKVAVLLAQLEGRREVNDQDWCLAEVIWRTSCAVRDHLVRHGAALVGKERAASVAAHAEREHAAEHARLVAQDQREGAAVVRVGRWLAERVHVNGPATIGDLGKRLASRDRRLRGDGLTYALSQGWIIDDDGLIRPADARPT